MSEDEFNQMIAEAKEKIGTDAILPTLELAARLFGWPIPPQFRETVMLPIAYSSETKPNKIQKM